MLLSTSKQDQESLATTTLFEKENTSIVTGQRELKQCRHLDWGGLSGYGNVLLHRQPSFSEIDLNIFYLNRRKHFSLESMYRLSEPKPNRNTKFSAGLLRMKYPRLGLSPSISG